MAWTVYVLRCQDGRLYTGITTDVARRLAQHRAGRGAHFTRAFGASAIVHRERYATRAKAASREAQLKTWSRAEKLALIARRRAGPAPLRKGIGFGKGKPRFPFPT